MMATNFCNSNHGVMARVANADEPHPHHSHESLLIVVVILRPAPQIGGSGAGPLGQKVPVDNARNIHLLGPHNRFRPSHERQSCASLCNMNYVLRL